MLGYLAAEALTISTTTNQLPEIVSSLGHLAAELRTISTTTNQLTEIVSHLATEIRTISLKQSAEDEEEEDSFSLELVHTDGSLTLLRLVRSLANNLGVWTVNGDGGKDQHHLKVRNCVDTGHAVYSTNYVYSLYIY